MSTDGPDTPAELKARALRHLVRREHSRAELARKLTPHAESPQAVEAVLDLLLDLKSRGVSDEISERVSSDLNELEKAKAILQRKYREPATTREEHAKRARFLQGRGFSYEVIKHVLSSHDDE